jgi:tRNA-Thr(GGU) m(6)t(6)A37 methyltransferase TsaA
MNSICYQPIGVIHSPFQDPVGMPIQSVAAQGIAGRIELDPAYREGMQDIAGFSHLILLYHLHLMRNPGLTVVPFLDDQPHGVFATRSPKRPNPIGLSIVRLVGIQDSTLFIEDMDIVDGTPLLDIKPYVPDFDIRNGAAIGWFAKNIEHAHTVRANNPQ